MKRGLLLVSVMLLSACNCQIDNEQDISEIKTTLHKSAADWSSGNIEAFMDAY